MSGPMTASEAESLLPFASTNQQREVLKLIAKHGSMAAAAKALGYSSGDGHVKNMVARIRGRAATQGFSPEHDFNYPVPETHVAKGYSILYDEDGKVKQTWVKSDLDREAREKLILEILEGLKSEIPKAKRQAKPKHKMSEQICNLFAITDNHFGAYAWHEETGEDWDIKIAEDLLVGWFEEAIVHAPDAKQAILAQMGDFLHFDSLEAVTPTNKHILDADTRHQLMVRVALRVLRRCVALLLAKHERVHIIMAEGNHDPAGSAWLREAFAIFYEDEPRVTVDTSPDPYYGFQWGKTALFFHHGHKRKVTNIADVFAAKFRKMFGETKHAYAHMGHLHHKHTLETNLMVVEQHRTLAAKDAYASTGGYMAGRDAQVISYHREYGEVGRVVVSPDMVRGAA